MDKIRDYVDRLFSNHRMSDRTLDIKEEITSNMQAMKTDLINEGLSEEEATRQAKQSITSLDGIITDNKEVYINEVKAENAENLFIAALIYWIAAIPTLIGNTILFPTLAFFTVVIFGIILYLFKKKDMAQISNIDIKSFDRYKKLVWIVWGILALVCVIVVALIYFSSNIWFSRKIEIDGPSQFFSIFARFYLPLATVVFPITVGTFKKTALKFEGDEHID